MILLPPEGPTPCRLRLLRAYVFCLRRMSSNSARVRSLRTLDLVDRPITRARSSTPEPSTMTARLSSLAVSLHEGFGGSSRSSHRMMPVRFPILLRVKGRSPGPLFADVDAVARPQRKPPNVPACPCGDRGWARSPHLSLRKTTPTGSESPCCALFRPCSGPTLSTAVVEHCGDACGPATCLPLEPWGGWPASLPSAVTIS